MNLSIVIPAYNEVDNIGDVLYEVRLWFPEAEIVVVDDASIDGTDILLKAVKKGSKDKNLKILTNSRNKGHGKSVIRGLKYAHGDYILYIDADRQLGLNNFRILQNVDFISGYRAGRQDKLFRKLVSLCLKMTILIKYGYYIKDANCPFKIYKRSALKPLLCKVPKTSIIPIACLEVLARKANLRTKVIKTPHKKYDGVRGGFLQSINTKSMKFFYKAYKEITSL